MAVAAMSGGCRSGESDERPVLVVSIEPQRHTLEQLAGDRYKIVTMMPSGENPETFEPSPVRRMELENAKAYFTTGRLLFEDKLYMADKDTSKYVDTSAGIDLIYGTHSHGGDHAEAHSDGHGDGEEHHVADPHVWSSLKNVRIMARNITAALIRIDPENSDEYTGRLKNYDRHLDSLDNSYREKLARVSNKVFFTWHPSLSYFARDYGFNQISVSSESKDISAERLAELLEMAKDNNVKKFIYQGQLDSRHAELIGTSLEVDAIDFNGLEYNWEEELSKVVDGLSKQ